MINNPRVVAVLPARMESSRLPRKALKDICGLPMIVHVFKRCLLSKKLDEVYVATDSFEIKEVVEKYDKKTFHHIETCFNVLPLCAVLNKEVFVVHGVNVKMSRGFVSTPMVSYGTKHFNASMGVVLTASHNPPDYNGYKLKSHHGGPLIEEYVKEVEAIIPAEHKVDLDSMSFNGMVQTGSIEIIDLETMYVNCQRFLSC